MAQLDFPLQLSPVYKPKIWGRRDLAPLFDHPDAPGKRSRRRAASPAPPAADEPRELASIGEVWITDDASGFMNGPLAGLTLAEACRQGGSELLGDACPDRRFPVLAKYLFTSDWLSVQVHPDDDYAARHDPGNSGKCEMWYMVGADAGAQYLLGSQAGVSKERLRHAAEQSASKDLLRAFHPKASEAVFVPPGTVHALGPGMVLFEAEQNSDLTYRLDDFGRPGLDGKPRELHWEKGFEVIDVERPSLRDLPRVAVREPFGWRRYVMACPFFAVEELALRQTASFKAARHRVEAFSVLEGFGRVETPAGWISYRRGETWLIPPGNSHYRLVPVNRTRLLKFYVPDVARDFRRPLEKRKVRSATIDRICFD